MIDYYSNIQKSIIQNQWANKVELNENSTAFLREFYDYLFEYYKKQEKWCANVFGVSQSHTTVITMITASILNLQPPREKIVMNCLKQNSNKLMMLEDISKANVYFGKLFIDSFNGHDGINHDLLNTFSSAVFDYFNVFIGQIASLEQQQLSSQLSELALVHTTAAESVRALGNAVGRIFDCMDETLKRCELITHNNGLSAIITVLNVNDITIFIIYKHISFI